MLRAQLVINSGASGSRSSSSDTVVQDLSPEVGTVRDLAMSIPGTSRGPVSVYMRTIDQIIRVRVVNSLAKVVLYEEREGRGMGC